MQVIEHQYIHYNNVISYTAKIKTTEITDFIIGLMKNINVLNINIVGKIAFTFKNDETEFIIPIDRPIKSNSYFSFKSEFKLVNAVRIRSYGRTDNIHTKTEVLDSYIKKTGLLAITSPYYLVQDSECGIYDIYIGINENIL